MPFNNWDIPASLFSIKPVNRDTLDNFIGREKLVSKLKRLIESKDIRFVIEGEIGTGKTSLGNYIRFTQEDSFTTDIEIMCRPHWGAAEFLLALQSAIVGTSYKNSDQFKDLIKLDIFKRIHERNSNIRISNPQGGVSVMGFGGSGGKAETISQPINLDEQTLILELHEMLKELREHLSSIKKCSVERIKIIFQMNNLDPNHPPFNEENIISFFNNIRDILTDKIDATFIINGAIGLTGIIKKSVPRLADCVTFEIIRSLTKGEMVEALLKRIKHSGHRGKLPFTEELIEMIYNSVNGNFRKSLGLMEELANYYDMEEPLVDELNIVDCCRYYHETYYHEVEDIVFKKGKITNKGSVIQILVELPMSNVSEIADKLGSNQGNVSRDITALENDGILNKIKEGDSVKCSLRAEYLFALKYSG